MATVLLTGASGFIAFHILDQLLQKGYTVRATARSQAKCDVIKKQYPNAKLEFAVVEDIAKKGGFDEAVKGVDYILHTASPFHMKSVGLTLLEPAFEGTYNMLLAAATEPQIRKVVITSSFAAILDGSKHPWPGHTYTDDEWSPLTWEDGMKGPAATSYRASKKVAEKAMWDFKEKNRPSFDIGSINPPLVFGPIINDQSLDSVNTSNESVWKFLSGQTKEVTQAGSAWVDVRDVAEAHILAMEAKGNERYFVTAGLFTPQMMVNVLRKHFPQLHDKIPKGDPSLVAVPGLDKNYQVDNSKSRKLGVTYRDFETSIVDTAESLIAMAKKEGKI